MLLRIEGADLVQGAIEQKQTGISQSGNSRERPLDRNLCVLLLDLDQEGRPAPRDRLGRAGDDLVLEALHFDLDEADIVETVVVDAPGLHRQRREILRDFGRAQ